MTRDAFIRRWRAACIMLGMDTLSVLQGQMREHKAQTLLDLPGQIDGLLSRMYDDLQPPKEPPKPVGNGAAKPATAGKVTA